MKLPKTNVLPPRVNKLLSHLSLHLIYMRSLIIQPLSGQIRFTPDYAYCAVIQSVLVSHSLEKINIIQEKNNRDADEGSSDVSDLLDIVLLEKHTKKQTSKFLRKLRFDKALLFL